MPAKNPDSTAISARSAQHATFVIERNYDATPTQVFAAWATPQAKSRWFGGTAGKWKELERNFDFRVGGCEHLKGTWDGGTVSDFEAYYQDIVPDQRIVYTYDMHINDKRISVSLSTVELKPTDKATHLIYTEQAVFLDGYDDAESRERGTRELLDKLTTALQPQ
ncbi:MAG: SRPBCC family protein [Gammaproteobacteria bacterium]